MSGILFVLFAPLIGGLLYGLERKLKARMQGRKGPPVLQPFYDLAKLTDKRPMVIHSFHAILGLAHFAAAWVALGVLALGGDLLIAIFFHLLSLSLLVAAGYSAKSAYSHLGSTRELFGALSLEPILVLLAVGFFVLTGSFEVSSIWQSQPHLSQLPLLFAALLFVMPIALKKSPFDAAEGHQEIVGGAEIEFSGVFFEAVYTARWLDYLFVYTVVALFGGSNALLGAALVVAAFLLINVVDNSTARLTYLQMTKLCYTIALPLAAANLLLIATGVL